MSLSEQLHKENSSNYEFESKFKVNSPKNTCIEF